MDNVCVRTALLSAFSLCQNVKNQCFYLSNPLKCQFSQRKTLTILPGLFIISFNLADQDAAVWQTFSVALNR